MKIWESEFTLKNKLTQEQLNFFEKNGVIVFRNFIDRQTVNDYIDQIQSLEKEWLTENKQKINGIPLKFGKDENGNKTIQRFCFLNQYRDIFAKLLKDERLKALTELLYPYEGRIAENEKDGLVLNSYIKSPHSTFSQMGWHTDSPRDLFLGQKIMPMLNIGIHLDDCPVENGGLRVIPGTQKQSFFKLLFRKKYFLDNSDDKNEVGFNMNAGDLSVHDGRLWHRAKQSSFFGEKSRRRVMYVPIITGKYMPKNEKSKTPFYHLFTNKAHS